MNSIYKQLINLIDNHTPCVITFLIDVQGSTPRKPGTKMIVTGDGKIVGTIGGGSLEKKVIEIALDVLRKGSPLTKTFDLEDDLSMHCGGTATVFFDPVLPAPTVFIFGAGHVAREVGSYAFDLGFQIQFIDPRPGIFTEFRSDYAQCHPVDYLEFANSCNFSERDYAVVTTPNHQFDESLAHTLARKNLLYVGVIASKRKAAIIRENAIKNNILTPEQANRIDMPIGIPFNAQTPKEIAISIVARLIDTKNNQTL
ncbi:MAG TPA: XdhC family protein [Salinivirgaceae bacterium]|nr:XdhC family protein [Salinivirgaceae bacterium]